MCTQLSLTPRSFTPFPTAEIANKTNDPLDIIFSQLSLEERLDAETQMQAVIDAAKKNAQKTSPQEKKPRAYSDLSTTDRVSNFSTAIFNDQKDDDELCSINVPKLKQRFSAPQKYLSSVLVDLEQLPSLSILKQRLGTTEKVSDLYYYIVLREPQWKEQLKTQQGNLYISHPKEDQAPIRPVQYNRDHSIFIHFTKKKNGDRYLGKGTTKIAKTAIDFKTGKVFASLSMSQASGTSEAIKLGMFRGVEGFLQLHYEVSYPNHKGGKNKTRLITDLAEDGDLYKAFGQNRIKRHHFKPICEQLVHGISYMHRKKYLHRDLKLENILVTGLKVNAVRVLIADVGTLCCFDDEQQRAVHSTTSWFASPEYALVMRKSNYQEVDNKDLIHVTTDKHDMWGLGAILYWLRIQIPPWIKTPEDHPSLELLSYLRETTAWFREPPNKRTFDHFIWRMLQKNPDKRISSSEAEKQLPHILYPS